MQLAEAQLQGASDTKVYDHVLVNDDFDATYEQLRAMMVRYRPDVMTRDEEEESAAAASGGGGGGSAAVPEPVLVLGGPPGSGGAQQLAAAMAAAFPDKFVVPQLLTDRKPAKGEASTPELQFVSAKDFAKMGAEGALALTYASEAGGSMAVSKEAMLAITSGQSSGAPAVVVLVLPDVALVAGLKQGPSASLPGALYAYIGAPSAVAAGGPEGAEAALVAARASELYGLVVSGDEAEVSELVAAARGAMSAHVPAVIPPPFRPIVIAGPFGTGKRVLLQRLFDQLPGKFAVPVATTSRPAGPSDLDDRSDMEVVPREKADAMLATPGVFLVHETTLDHVYGITAAAVKKVQSSGRVCVLELDHVADARRLRDEGFEATYIFIGVDSMDELFRYAWGWIRQRLCYAAYKIKESDWWGYAGHSPQGQGSLSLLLATGGYN